MARFFLLFIFVFKAFTAVGQISGTVYSAKDSVALQGVSVYFDGTSIGTVTNSSGTFNLQTSAATTPLVISFLGYRNLILPPLPKGGNLGPLYLQENIEQLGEVVVETDTWSREKKLRYFTREFLGNSAEAAKCRIRNPEVLDLHYSPSKKVLTAYAEEPLEIINRHLGYEITYSLSSFQLQFSVGTSGLSFVHFVSFEGTSFFKNLRDKPRKKHLRNREASYVGSSLHFMRSLAARRLEENGFHIYHQKFRVAPYQHFELKKEGELTRVELNAEKVSILFSGIEQSELQTVSPFYIDGMGNHTPPLAVILGGQMAAQRIAHLLPLNY